MVHGTVIQGYFRGGRAPVLQAALPAGRVVQAKAPLPFAATGGKPATVAGPKVIAPPPVRFPGQKPASAQAKPAPVAPAQALSRFTVPLPKPALQAKPAPVASNVVQLRGGGEAFAVPSTLNLSNPGGGRPLPAPVREKMESFFGTSFTDVRIHVGPQAASIGALAFTHGTNLYFAPGQYNPNTAHGQQLLGHELTHVVQQRAGRVKNPFGSGVAVVQDRGLETEADRMGAWASMATGLQTKDANASIPRMRNVSSIILRMKGSDGDFIYVTKGEILEYNKSECKKNEADTFAIEFAEGYFLNESSLDNMNVKLKKINGDISICAAVILHTIVTNHVFVAACKRTASWAAEQFVSRNGKSIGSTEGITTDMAKNPNQPYANYVDRVRGLISG